MTAPPDKWLGDVSPNDRVADVAARTLRARLAAVRHYLPLAAGRADEDVEHVHELRVWTRRATAALRLYADRLPRRRAAWLRKQLKRLRRAANDARDLDVLAARLADPTRPYAGAWLAEVRAQRAQAQEPIVAAQRRLKRRHRFGRRIAKLLRRVRRRGRHGGGPEPERFGDWARARLRPFVESFFEAIPADETDVAALHAFRIRGKELRYAMELLAGAFPANLRDDLYSIVETLQDKLGAINDRAAGQSHLRRRIGRTDDPAEGAYLRQLYGQEQIGLEQSRHAFADWFTPELQRRLRAGFDSLLFDGPGERGRVSVSGERRAVPG